MSVWAPKCSYSGYSGFTNQQVKSWWLRPSFLHSLWAVVNVFVTVTLFWPLQKPFGCYLIALWLKCNRRIWTCVSYASGALQGGVTFGRNQGAFCFRQISEFHNHCVTEKSCLTRQYLRNAATPHSCRNSALLSPHAWSKRSFLHTLNIYVLIWAIFL